MKIRDQILSVMIGFLVLATVIFTWLLYQVQSQAYESGIDHELYTAALMAKELLPPGYHERITDKNSVSDAEFSQIVDRFNRLCVQANLEYLWSLMILDGKIVFTSATSPSKDASKRDHAGFLDVHTNPELYTKVFETMQPQYQINDDKWGRIRVVLIPFLDSHGRKYLVGASRSMREVDAQTRATLVSSILAGGGVLCLGMLASLWLANSLARPIAAATQAASEIAHGNFSHKAPLYGARELNILGDSINAMSQAIQTQMQELSESREDLRITLQSIGDAVIATNAEGLVTWMNPVAETLTGWTQIQAQGQPLAQIFQIVNSDTRTPLENPASIVLREQRIVGLANHAVLLAKDGTERQIADSAAPIRASDGGIAGVVLVFRDVTAQYAQDRALRESEARFRVLNNELEQRVRERTVQLEAANKELEAFSYSVSHDLRAPLRAIDGFSRILLESDVQNLDVRARHYFDQICANAQYMGQLVDGLLNFSRLGRQALNLKTVVPNELVEWAIHELHAEQEGRQMEISVAELPVCMADVALLKQVFFNLLTNAYKFTRQKTPARIEVGYLEEDGQPIYFVKDNGVGFDMHYAHKLFCVFQRLHRAEEYEGTGVGLSIVQRIIDKHGGRVWAEAVPEQGATFYFTLSGEAGH